MTDPSRHYVRPLDALQRWFQSVITHPDGVEAGVTSDGARREIDVAPEGIEQVITRSKALDSLNRLAVYGNAYYARLLECLRDFFPVLVHAVGEETFDQFAFGYLQQYPSTSYTLDHLADRFPQYLTETRPDREAAARGEVAWPDFLIDLAQLELTIQKVFDGPGVEKERVLTAEELQRIDPVIWPQVRLQPVPCLRLLAFKYPVNDYFTAVRKEEQPELPEPQTSYVALTRRDYVVRRIPLVGPQYDLLGRLVAGESVGAAIAAVADSGQVDVEQFAAELTQWFREWTAAGLFRKILLPGGERP